MILSEDRNGPLRPVRATEGMDEDDQIECSPRGFARLRGIDVGLEPGRNKPTPESPDRRGAGAGEDRDCPAQRRTEHQGSRWSRAPPRRRPYYGPIQRMRILRLKAARGWSSSQTAGVFLITEETIASWLRRIDEEGEPALFRSPSR